MRTKIIPLVMIGLIMAGISACDVSGDQNYSIRQGNSLAIIGTNPVTIPQDTTTAITVDSTDVVPITVSYYSRAYTVDKDYSWTVSGSAQGSVYRGGEYNDVTFTETGTYTITVDDGEYQGSLDVTVTRQPNEDLE